MRHVLTHERGRKICLYDKLVMTQRIRVCIVQDTKPAGAFRMQSSKKKLAQECHCGVIYVNLMNKSNRYRNINSHKLTRWYELHMINKSVVAKSNEDLYPKSREAMADKSVSP
jgi:hypothetical protein